MKQVVFLVLSLSVLLGTGVYLLHRERRSVPLQIQLEAHRVLNGRDTLKLPVDAAIGKPSAPEAAVAGLATPVEALAEKHEAAVADPDAYRTAAPLSEKEVASVRALVGTFFRGEKGKAGLSKFIRDLQTAGLEPVIANGENSQAGKMFVVHTKDTLEGTRYLHAQFFRDEAGKQDPIRQSFSFDIRSSPDSMKVARRLLEEAAGRRLGKPESISPDKWVEWKSEGQSVWIQRLGKDDIAHDQSPARESSEVGAVRVAIERIPTSP